MHERMRVPPSDSPTEGPPTQAEPADSSQRPSAARAMASRRHPWRVAGVIAIVVIAGMGAFAWVWLDRTPRDAARLELEGNIDVRQVNLAFKVEGRITSVNVDEGDEVTKGQVLAVLDKRYFEDDLRLMTAQRDNAKAGLEKLEHGSRPEEIAEARAQVDQAQASLARAKQDFERASHLVGKGAVSKEDFDRAKATLEEAEAQLKYNQEALRLAEIGPRQEDIAAARAQLAAQEAALSQAQRRLQDSELIAPNDGIILTRARENGAIVSAGETVFTLTLNSPVWVRTYVNERDLGRIEPGLAAEVKTDSAPRKIYHGHIGFISPTAEFTPKTVETRELRTDLVYRLRVVVDNPDGGLRQGMPVSVTVLRNQAN